MERTQLAFNQQDDAIKSPTYQEARNFIRSSLVNMAKNYIAIGYTLKYVRDHELFRKGGYRSISEFAQAEYGFSRSVTSRCMSANDRFSKGGNSPVIQEQYQEFNKGQLQEMLYLDDEQLERVKPTDRAEDIRAMRKPKETPCKEISEKVERRELPGIGSKETDEDGVAISQQEWSCENGSVCLENVAEPAAEALSAYGTPKRIYPPDSLIAEEGCEGGHDCFLCAMDCQIRGKERHCREAPTGNPFSCEIVKGGFTELPESCQFVNHDLAEHYAGSGEPDPCCKNCQEPCEYICGRAMKALDQAAVILEADQESTQDEKDLDESYNLGDLPQVRDKYLDELAQMMVNYMGNRMVTFGGPSHMKDDVIEEKLRIFADKSGGVIRMSEGVTTYPCGELIEFIRGEEDLGISSFRRFANHVRKIMENWTPQIPEAADGPDDTDLELICKMLDKEKRDLNEMEKVLQEEPDRTLGKITRKKRLMVKAIERLLGEMDQPEKEEQQELPVLKNNDQRKEWLNTYREWPVWFEVPLAAEVYYRYDLPDGCSLVICEYHYWASWRVKFKYGGDPESTGTREYLLTPGYHYLEDCKSNRTSMIEKLKEIQKAGGKNEEK